MPLAQLQGADLSHAEFQGANLSEVQLQGANLFDAQLQGAYLSRAQLQGAYLSRAELQGADLSRAQLQGADLSNAQLHGADLLYAQLQGALFDRTGVRGANFVLSELKGNIGGGPHVKRDIDWDKEIERIKNKLPAEKITEFEKNMRYAQKRALNSAGFPQFDNDEVLFNSLNSELACTNNAIAKRYCEINATPFPSGIINHYDTIAKHIKKNCPPKN